MLVPKLMAKLSPSSTTSIVETQSKFSPQKPKPLPKTGLLWSSPPRPRPKLNNGYSKLTGRETRNSGEKILEKAFRVYGTSLSRAIKSGLLKQALDHFNYSSPEELYIHVGQKKWSAKAVMQAIPEFSSEAEGEKGEAKIKELDEVAGKITHSARKAARKDNAVIVNGMDDLMIRMAKCCNPIPGDFISGHITRGRGITVHRTDCQRMKQAENSRTIKVEWNSEYFFKHPVGVRVITNDRPGVLSNISKVINNIGVNIRAAIATSLMDAKGSFLFEVEVQDYAELLKVISAIESVPEVISVNRI